MPFVEIQPKARQNKSGEADGIRVSSTPKRGIRVAIAGKALAALGGGDGRFRVLLDADPDAPRLRIERADGGPFSLATHKARGTISGWRSILVGLVAALPAIEMSAVACTWDGDGRYIDVDLPSNLKPPRLARPPASNPTAASRAGAEPSWKGPPAPAGVKGRF